MGLPPFGNLFMLTYTGGYTCDPDFQIVLQAKERLRTQNMFSHQKSYLNQLNELHVELETSIESLGDFCRIGTDVIHKVPQPLCFSLLNILLNLISAFNK